MADGKLQVNTERLVREFEKLVEFDSESFSEREVADYVKTRLTELGLTVEEDAAGDAIGGAAGNLYAVLPGNLPEGNVEQAILLSSHLDTVKPGKGKKAVLHENGRITSEGTTVLGADDAAGLAESLEALTVIGEQSLPHPDLELILPVAEEPYAQGSRVFDYGKVKAKTAYVLDLSGPVGRAAVAAPSIISLTIRVKGKAAHAGFCPEAGIHAIRIAAEAIAVLPEGHLDDTTTVNLGTITGGVAENIVPDTVEIRGEIRSMEHESALAVADEIKKVFEDAAEAAGGQAEVLIREQFRAYRIREDEYTVAHFREACGDLGLSGKLEDTFGGSDNNHFTAHGIRGIVVANAMNEVHTVEEWTSTEELTRAAELVLRLVTV